MTLGLVTQHNLRNYGSDLQAYSLYSYLSEQGIDVSIINYWLPSLKEVYNIKYAWDFSSPISFAKRALSNAVKLYFSPEIKKSHKRFDAFRKDWKLTKEYIGEDSIEKDPPIFDTYLCGSDAIWHPKYIQPARALHFAKNLEKRKIAYAPSIGTLNISKDQADKIKNLVSHIDFLSCREKAGANFLSELINKDVETVIDPVFLHSEQWWKNVANLDEPIIKGDYIFAYLVTPNKTLVRELTKKIKQKYGLPIIAISNNLSGNFAIGTDKTILNAGPTEFLNILYHSKAVLASSFHGTAFGLLFKKDVYAIKSIDLDTRIEDIFERTGINKGRIISPQNIDLDYLDYSNFTSLLNNELEKSKTYLNKALNI